MQRSLGNKGVEAVPREFAFDKSNAPQLVPMKAHIGLSVNAPVSKSRQSLQMFMA